MTQEEKAKAYDEAFEIGKTLHKNGAYRLLMEEIFSQLKESEDERVRKQIRELLLDTPTDELRRLDIDLKKAFDWLEKQSKDNMIEALRLEYEKGKSDVLQEQRKEWSEEDERIRKAIISLIQNGGYMSKEFKEKAFSWLEKQRYSEFELENEYWRGYDDAKFHLKEDKVTVIGARSNSTSVSDGDNSVTSKEVVSYPTTSTTFKPKFKVGDFIVNDYCMGRVVELTNDAYLLDTEQGIPFSYEHNVHLWTIEDAKDGDIIYIKRCKNDSEWLLIFKKIKSQNNYIDVYDYYAFSITTGSVYHDFNEDWGLLYDGDIVRPATKEQCDILFAKIKESGYEWDTKKKELKKIEQKFKVGDWITNSNETVQITGYDIDYGYQVDYKGNLQHRDSDIIEKEYHLWTIQDAKDGDVLCCESGWTCIFKALDNHTNTFSSYCFMDKSKWFCNTGSECHTLDKAFIKAYNGEIHPATKEQRDLLFQKMKDAGYEWDAEKKELKKIEKERPLLSDFFNSEYERGKADAINEMKSVWSEEDGEKFRDVIRLVEQGAPVQSIREHYTNWLKSLKDRYTWKPSDEQMEALADALSLAKNCGEERAFDLRTLYEQLQKIKENKL